MVALPVVDRSCFNQARSSRQWELGLPAVNAHEQPRPRFFPFSFDSFERLSAFRVDYRKPDLVGAPCGNHDACRAKEQNNEAFHEFLGIDGGSPERFDCRRRRLGRGRCCRRRPWGACGSGAAGRRRGRAGRSSSHRFSWRGMRITVVPVLNGTGTASGLGASFVERGEKML